MRGLKFGDVGVTRNLKSVALPVSAWIEIIIIEALEEIVAVALPVSAWIEIKQGY